MNAGTLQGDATFNRTMMELKPGMVKDMGTIRNTFNRTMMELKHWPEDWSVRGEGTFNRTMMELKQYGHKFTAEQGALLIAP